MKRKGLLKTVLLLCALVVGGGSVWATEEVYYTLDGTLTDTGGNSNYAQTGDDVVQSEMSWSVTANCTQNPWRIGGKNLSGVNREVYSKTAMGDAITKVELEIGGITLTSVNSITLIVASNSDFSTVLQTIEKTSISANSTLIFNPSGSNWATGAYYKFVFNVTAGSSNSYIQLKSAKFYHEVSGGGGGSTTVATPTFDPAGGTYTSAQSVEISCGTEDASIYYTTNGNNPDDTSTPYTSAISITTSGTTLKAIAYKDGMTASSIASATYTIKPTTPTINAAGATVTITGDDGCTFYYTTDNSAPSSTSTEYTAPFDLTEDCTIKAIAYDTYGNASGVKSYSFKYMPLSPKNINSGYFEKVTNVTSLENGDAILIINESANVAMSTTQNSNNRGMKSVTISENIIYAPGEDVQKLVLVKTTEKISDVDTDVFYFYTGAGYLYAASGSSNHLKTEIVPDDNNNARATIAISSGNATITFTGSNARNLLKYNSSDKLFSCYASGQSPVQIYKEVAHNETATISSVNWTTFSSPYALNFTDFTDANAYMVTDASETTLTLEQVTGTVPANTGLLISGTADDTVNIPVTASSTTDVSDNKLVAGTGATVNAADKYVLVARDGKAVFAPTSGTAATVAVGKAYLDLEGVLARGFVLDESETTGITSMHNSQSIMHNDIFDLQGRRVSQPTKGLYIVNGKKVIIK